MNTGSAHLRGLQVWDTCGRVAACALCGIALVSLMAAASPAGAACVATSVAPSVTICAPAASSTVSNPVNVQAAAASNTAVTKFLLYIDNVEVYQALNVTSVNANLTVAAGSHYLTAQFYNGAWVKQAESFTVSVAPPAVSVSMAPSTVNVLTGSTQQLTATVQNTTDTDVSWSVDGTPGGSSVVGTIAGSGDVVNYVAPAATGLHTVTVTSMADPSKSASAVVNVTATAAGFPSSSHVFVVMEENQSFAQVFPSGGATNCAAAGMPFLCGLAAANGLALDLYANSHGSLRDYLYITSGANWTGSPYNCTGSNCSKLGVIAGDNMVRALTSAGKSWRGYFEGMPSQGYMGGDTNGYYLHHNPFPWYSDVAGSAAQQQHMYPFTQLAKDETGGSFADFNFIVPNDRDDADDPAKGTSPSVLLARADSWLQTNIEPLLTTAPFQAGGDGILIIVFDEGDVAGESGDTKSDSACSPTQSSGCGGHVAFAMIGPQVNPGSTTSTTYHFQDVLHTVLHLLGVRDYMNGAASGGDVGLLPGVN
jgi:phosphatidylinositol-3-phosphatase